MTTIEQIRAVSDAHGFTPTGLWDYLRDCQRHPELHIPGIVEEMFADFPTLKPAAITRELARKAEGFREPVPMLAGHPLYSVVRWMGREGWTYHEAKKTILAAGLAIDKQRILVELANGEDEADHAPLTEYQITKLYDWMAD